jgi:glycerophosphoryl diester phosphodiesterase
MGITPIVFAHRGFSSIAPENTMIAFEKALGFGATGIELDVQLSRDGEVMICHDEKLDRTTNGHGLLVQYTRAELQQLDAGSWFSPHFAGVRIPTLMEVLELLQGRSTILNIELKTGIVDYPELEESVLELTHRYGMHERTIYSSFNHYSMKKLKEVDATARIALLYIAGLYEPWQYAKQLGADAIHPLYYNIRPELVTLSHSVGIKVNPYTVDQESDLKRMVQCGVDGIITNYPDRLLKILGEQ